MKVNKIIQNTKIISTMEVDYYVPITVTVDNNLQKIELFYYRFINSEYSFIEFIIDNISKQVMRIVVVTIREIHNMSAETYNSINGVMKNGIPLINLPNCDNNVYTENIEFTFYKYGNKILALMNDNKVITRAHMNEIEFLLDENNEVVGIVFNNLSNNDWFTLNEKFNKLHSFT